MLREEGVLRGEVYIMELGWVGSEENRRRQTYFQEMERGMRKRERKDKKDHLYP